MFEALSSPANKEDPFTIPGTIFELIEDNEPPTRVWLDTGEAEVARNDKRFIKQYREVE